MKTLNGYEVVDAKARQDIEVLKNTEVDLTPYALKSELPTKVSQLQNDSRFITLEEVPETDLSAYAKKSELPTVPKKVSELTNDAGYITAAEVPKTDLSAYAKKTDIPDVSGFITSIPSEYVTESELNAKGYLTAEDLPESIDTSRFLTKVDNNDQYMWYATTTNANQVIQNHVPIEKTDSKLDIVVGGKTLNNNTIAVREGLQIRVPEAPTNAGHAASKAYVDKAIAAIPEVDLSSYAKKSDIPDVSGFISEIPSEYVTDSELAAKGYLVEANLSEYAKKSEIPTVPTKTSQLTNDSNFLTAVPAEYVTETELNNKGYLTQHQSLEGYATKTYVDDAIAGIDIPEATTFFLDFSTATSMDQAATEAMVAFANYFKNNDNVSVYMRDSFESDYYYPALIQKVGTYTFNFLKAGINLNDVESNGALNWDTIRLYSSDNGATWKYTKLTNRSTTIATKTYVDNAIANIDIPSTESFATKSYVDTAVDDCKDVFFLDFSNATTTAQPATAQMIEFGDRFFMKEKTDISVMVKDTQSNCFYPALMDRQFDTRRILFIPIAINLNNIDGTSPCTWDTISLFRVFEGPDYVWKYQLLSQGTSTTIATKSYVDTAISALEARVAALEGGTK